MAALFYFPPALWFFAFLTAAALVALFELAGMARVNGKYPVVILSIIAIIPLYWKLFPFYMIWLLLSPLLFVIITLIAGGGRKEDANQDILKGVVVMLAGEVFFVLPFYSIYLLKETGTALPLILLLSLWASDICAYTMGKTLGRRPLAPRISPKKTWEGLAGAMLGTMIIIVAFHKPLGFAYGPALIIGAAMGLLGQIGDLLESAAKRVCDIKDSSGLIPGHGGILDRVDSFLFSAPFLYICVQWGL